MSFDSTQKPRSRKAKAKPKKPYKDFPLTPHASGAWMKKIRGKIHYFGKWARRAGGKLEQLPGDDWWKPALEEYKAVADDLHAGRTPRVKSDGLTVADLCNRFLTAKQRQYEAGEISARMFRPGPTPELASGEYKTTTDRLVEVFGANRLVVDLAADDFETLRDTLAKRFGPVRLGNEIQKVRTVFKYGYESGLIDRPVRYGPQFKKPSKVVMRRHKAQQGPKLFTRQEILALLLFAPVPLEAMILLGLNAGLGNTDCASLPLSALDLESGWIDFPRPKTGIARRCPLWPETVAAIREVIANRPEPKHKEAAQLVFLTVRGTQCSRLTRTSRVDNVSIQFRELLKRLKLHRRGTGFYTLRHVHRTIADGARDLVAADIIMGHADPSMGAHYRERVEDSRLQVVANHVRHWLFGKP